MAGTAATPATTGSTGSKRTPKPISAPRVGDVWISPPSSPTRDTSQTEAKIVPFEQINEANAAAALAQAKGEAEKRTLAGGAAATPGSAAAPGVILRIKRKRGQEPVDSLQIGSLLDEREGAETNAAVVSHEDVHSQEMREGGRSRKRLSVMRDAEVSGSTGSSSTLGTGSASRSQMFRLAETVDVRHFSDPTLARDLSRRLAKLSPRASTSSNTQAAGGSPRASSPSAVSSAETNAAQASRRAGPPLRFQVVRREAEEARRGSKRTHKETTSDQSRLAFVEGEAGEIGGDTAVDARPAPCARQSLTVLKSNSRQSLRGAARAAGRSKGSGQLPALRRMRIIDAIAIGDSNRRLARRQQREKKNSKPMDCTNVASAGAPDCQSRKCANEYGEEDGKRDVEMDQLDRKFAGLLGDYLKETNLEPPSDLRSSISRLTQTAPTLDEASIRSRAEDRSSDSQDEEGSITDMDSDEEDYVYDVYYREASGSGVDKWATDLGSSGGGDGGGSSRIGLEPAPVAGHEAPPLPLVVGGAQAPAEVQYIKSDLASAPVALLEGLRTTDLEELPDDEEDYDLVDFKTGGPDSADEWDEGEDEDSNDEGFYRNDYPDHDMDSEDDVAWDDDGEEEEE